MFRQNDSHEIERDLIMRQIKQIVQLVARLLKGGAAEVKRDTALDELHRTASDLLRMDVKMLELVDARSAADLLRRPERIELYARIVCGQAEIFHHIKDTGAEKAAKRRALQLFVESALRAPLDEESLQIVRGLRGEVVLTELAARYTDWLRDKLPA